MFGNKNAGTRATRMRSALHRRHAKPKNGQIQIMIPTPRKGFEMFDQRETYFAVRGPIRWTL